MARSKKEVSAVQTSEPVEAKQTKGKGRRAAAPEEVPVQSSENVVVTSTPQVEQSVEQQSEQPVELSSDFSKLISRVQEVNSMLSSLRTELRALERRATRELKSAQRQNARRRRKSGNRAPSGFVKPTLISNELATFLGKDKGTEMARTEVTKEINAYIRANNLQDKTNGRQINADAKLTSLLNLKKGDVLTYFNLQKYMSPHFAKAGNSTASA